MSSLTPVESRSTRFGWQLAIFSSCIQLVQTLRHVTRHAPLLFPIVNSSSIHGQKALHPCELSLESGPTVSWPSSQSVSKTAYRTDYCMCRARLSRSRLLPQRTKSQKKRARISAHAPPRPSCVCAGGKQPSKIIAALDGR